MSSWGLPSVPWWQESFPWEEPRIIPFMESLVAIETNHCSGFRNLVLGANCIGTFEREVH